jgi:glutamate dehydrogenase (NADP+)
MQVLDPTGFARRLAQRNPQQPEYLQAVTEVMDSLWPFLAQHPHYAEHGLLERLVEPERTVMFRVGWVDDQARSRSTAATASSTAWPGPLQGRLRFHPR